MRAQPSSPIGLVFLKLCLAAALAGVVGSGCRSVSVEFGAVSPGATAEPSLVVAALAQQPSSTPAVAAETPTPRATSLSGGAAAAAVTADTQQVGAGSSALAGTPGPTAFAEPAASATLSSSAPTVVAFAPHVVTETRSGEITNQEQRDAYHFDGKQGQLLEVRAKRTVGVSLQPLVEVIDPAGATEISSRFQSGAEVLVERILSSTGAYQIVVSSFRGGQYSVVWSLDRYGQLGDGARVNAELTGAYQKDRYRFEATQGQLLTARVQRSAGVSFLPNIALKDPTGATEVSRDHYPLPDLTLEVKLASSGTYTLVVWSDDPGPYVVMLSIR